MKKLWLNLILLLFSFSTYAHTHSPGNEETLNYQYQRIVRTTQDFINMLTPPQRMRLIQPYNSPFRTRGFCYTLASCRDFSGLLFFNLNTEQKVQLNKLLLSLLSTMGYRNIVSIMERQVVLNEMETMQRKYPFYLQLAGPSPYDIQTGSPAVWSPPLGRSNLEYSLIIFGSLDANQWAIRFEGHHISVNFTFVKKDGHVYISPWPLFMGSNPMVVPRRPDFADEHLPFWTMEEGYSVLWRQVILARDFVLALNDKQRAAANWRAKIRSNLMGGTEPKVNSEIQNQNPILFLAVKDLPAMAKYLLKEYLKEYFYIFDTAIANQFDLDRIVEQAKFSWWSNNLKSDFSSFYLRVVSGDYLIELNQFSAFSVVSPGYDSIHIHSAVRNIKEDWDTNVIGSHEHYHYHQH